MGLLHYIPSDVRLPLWIDHSPENLPPPPFSRFRMISSGIGMPRLTGRLACWAIIMASIFCAAPCPAAPGLEVKDGRLTMEDKPVHLVGVNYFDAFSRVLADDSQAESYRKGFRKLKEHGVPFIRFNCGGFYPVDWKIYQTDRERYFQLLDRFVADAGEHGIGLVPSLFWFHLTVPGLNGEPLDAWGDPASRTHTYMRTYVSEVVRRYQHSPVIWAWEFGNEYNLAVDLPGGAENHKRWFHPSRELPEHPQPRDHLTTNHLMAALQAFGTEVRKHDPHRPIISGHAMPRTAAHHLEKGGTWQPDTREEWMTSLLRSHPSPLDLLSVHYYPYHKDDGSGIHGLNHRDSLKACVSAGESVGKPLFVGEFGPAAGTDAKTRMEQTSAMIDTMVSMRIPLSAVWVFDFPHQDVSIPADNQGDEILEKIRAANLLLK